MGKKSTFSIVIVTVLGVLLIGGTTVDESFECSDGIDNDEDGGIDTDPGTEDVECIFHEPNPMNDPFNTYPPTVHQCATWDDESNPPATLDECLGL